ncbi:nitroreductase family deazaflavin-dependent oxidoreductase [Couchioplanes caeruleus]|uniref:nitroreductase/quinone reductase family protein n=1 Tax=Couchioplanes caeruleus TaxID=56438 RepID=UPI0020BFA9DA|nr:nitroreductase/quinone reductase family protein [Couchioplanes caeruleus]UQU62056.1 nitroreductase family deazaflavin-dependent oxidoreductase [Couchioplanes caeruleus]
MASSNDSIIETFRANDGVVGGPFEGKTLLLLHHRGRRSGKEFVTPLVAAPDEDAYVICGSLGGGPEDPQWIANLEAAAGATTVELGPATFEAGYEVIRPGDPRWAETYGVWRDYWPQAREYEQKTDRKFPVVRVQVPPSA